MEQNETIPITVAYNQNVENAGVAFVKAANERNELFKKKTGMYSKRIRTNKAND